ncbi:hypothetical protein K438DRAFT_1770230 [Mycena galopus ATCC 62051]|nr:hypothetical protein K438DRAFT_1770230 [Mycena galopus ATCC 62051]
MSEQPPHTPFTLMYAPELSCNTNGNILYRDAQGCWLPYNGPLLNQPQAMPEHATQQLGHVPLNDRTRGGPSSPIEHAFAPQPEYQFTLRPVQSSTPQAPIPIDPALLPLPGGPDLDLRDGPTIANAIGLKRAEKVGGSHCKGKEHADPKGKKRQRASSSSDNDSEPVAKCGLPHGSANYGKDDIHKMFNLVAELLPVGQKGWKEVERRYNKWAKQMPSIQRCRGTQLRDERATTENLRSENTILRNRIHNVKRALERAELRNEMMGLASSAMTYWVSDPSTNEYHNDDDDEENRHPWDTFVPHRSHHTALIRTTQVLAVLSVAVVLLLLALSAFV